MLRTVMYFLAAFTGLYSLLIFIRILLTWFSGTNYGKPMEILSRITDPYLNWWRRIPGLQAGFLDLSPIVAIAVLSIAQSVFSTVANYGRISLGIVLAIALPAVWSAVSFILGFCIIVLVLRFIAYMFNRNTYSAFWRVIDAISQPLLYRINRIIFGRRLVNYMTGLLVSIAVLAALWIGGRVALRPLTVLLSKLPV